LAAIVLKEKLGPIGIIGCILSLIGAVIIVLHAPSDPDVQSVQELLSYILQPGFIVYGVLVVVIAILMIWRAVPRWGRTKPIVYVTICSLVGSLSVMAIKAFGIAVRLTISGSNQFTRPSTYFFMVMCIICILVQLNYFNKALDTFSTNCESHLLCLLHDRNFGSFCHYVPRLELGRCCKYDQSRMWISHHFHGRLSA